MILVANSCDLCERYTLKLFMQNVHGVVSCVARSAVLLKPHVVYIVQFGLKEIRYRSVVFTVDSDGLTNVVLENIRTNHTASPKSAPNSNFLLMHRYLVNLMWVGVVPYTAIMLVNIVSEDNCSAKIRVLGRTKGRVLVHDEELTASGSSTHFHGHWQRSQYICCSFDVWV
ncbi:hypothetical protein J6590_039620 [Homalodisca vitripennis]|nr:hypothetical protein J6590_039620 [Homalodisca vitripennis]